MFPAKLQIKETILFLFLGKQKTNRIRLVMEANFKIIGLTKIF